MAQLEPYREELDRLGVGLAYVAAEKRHGIWHPEKYLREHPTAFPFLLDEDRLVTKAYGLYHRLVHDALRIARPATLVIDWSGAVRYIYLGQNQLDRAPVEEVLGAVKQIATRPSP